jgi:hypothetical protein
LRQFDEGRYHGVAVLPGNVLWAGFDSRGYLRHARNGEIISADVTDINVFDLVTGSQIGSFTLDQGQLGANAMFYSTSTNTVLITDRQSDAVYERATDGKFLRSFTAPGMGEMAGVTRGPGGHVFVTDFHDNGVYRWTADGGFVGFFPLSRPFLTNIVWTGNSIPEPASMSLIIGCLVWSVVRLPARRAGRSAIRATFPPTD